MSANFWQRPYMEPLHSRTGARNRIVYDLENNGVFALTHFDMNNLWPRIECFDDSFWKIRTKICTNHGKGYYVFAEYNNYEM